eukprot:CAMPEP_0177634924 /NCGR_PEP_ID=MMETSP0447-20121125/3627_1 /TAXON_ID=0 /ORGANISM="Stygamoeba regulata, Strain BSH-02190019" /LENGTH=213 /DNA_ID=CAMNT_0019136677 /DNA_START=83 /DNA_END=723 /DNA_ORIENTATION=+
MASSLEELSSLSGKGEERKEILGHKEVLDGSIGLVAVPGQEMHDGDYQVKDTKDMDQIERRSGRRKINIEFIEDKSRRHITFSKRKAGIMKKAYELSTLTGTQVLLLVASETGHVYTFATPKLQPLITKAEGKNLIQACLNAPDVSAPQMQAQQRMPSGFQGEPGLCYGGQSDLPDSVYDEEKKVSSLAVVNRQSHAHLTGTCICELEASPHV